MCCLVCLLGELFGSLFSCFFFFFFFFWGGGGVWMDGRKQHVRFIAWRSRLDNESGKPY